MVRVCVLCVCVTVGMQILKQSLKVIRAEGSHLASHLDLGAAVAAGFVADSGL